MSESILTLIISSWSQPSVESEIVVLSLSWISYSALIQEIWHGVKSCEKDRELNIKPWLGCSAWSCDCIETSHSSPPDWSTWPHTWRCYRPPHCPGASPGTASLPHWDQIKREKHSDLVKVWQSYLTDLGKSTTGSSRGGLEFYINGAMKSNEDLINTYWSRLYKISRTSLKDTETTAKSS